jgi:hypothetical protein
MKSSDIMETKPLNIGIKTKWGKITAVGITGGERYYWMVDKHGCVAMMPASVVEPPNVES